MDPPGVSGAPVAMELVYPPLCMGILLTISQLGGYLSADEEPVVISTTEKLSSYHNQVLLIKNFLLSEGFFNKDYNTTKSNNSVSDIKFIVTKTDNNTNEATSLRDNYTTSNTLQFMPIPAVYPLVTDMLPGHLRIPRGSKSGRRRNGLRQHRHSTRVYIGVPVRFLLPPFENQVHQSIASSYSADPVIITPSSLTQSTTEDVTESKQVKIESKEPLQNTAALQYRKVFIPPPLRYLLPPFFYENYINAQPLTTQTPLSQETSPIPYSPLINDDYSTSDLSMASIIYQNTSSSTSLSPIIIIETITEDELEKGMWNQQSSSNIEYTTLAQVSNPTKDLQPTTNSPKDIYTSQSTTELLNSEKGYGFSPQFGSYKMKSVEKTTLKTDALKEINNQNKHSSVTTYATFKLSKPQVSDFKLPSNKYSFRPTSTPLKSRSTTSNFPILRGPNVEQTLFETGHFHGFETTTNESDKTMDMMNKPLLSQAVAEAGMKITVNMKEEMVKNKKNSRGKLKYHHLNQFNFVNPDTFSSKGSIGSKPSQLLVAETSYYNDRRKDRTKHQKEETADINTIPGIPGRDYPILMKASSSQFSCQSVKHHRGYIADSSTGCQVFYICVGNGSGEPMLCPNGTIFSQDFLVCDWWYNVDCQPQT